MRAVYGYDVYGGNTYDGQRTAEDYGYQLDGTARKRPNAYPAVPFENRRRNA